MFILELVVDASQHTLRRAALYFHIRIEESALFKNGFRVRAQAAVLRVAIQLRINFREVGKAPAGAITDLVEHGGAKAYVEAVGVQFRLTIPEVWVQQVGHSPFLLIDGIGQRQAAGDR